MRELYESCTLNSSVSSEKKKNAKFDKSSECTECRCFPPFVKVHHFDCPLVKKQPCPIHGACHRTGKTDSCMVITLHPNLPNEGWLYPVEASVTGGKTCCSTAKPDVIAYSNKHYYQTRKSLRSQEVQTNLEDIKKSRYFFDGNSYVKAVKYNGLDKSQRFKKMKKCFLSPCGSPAYTSISENAVEDFDIRKSKNVSVQVRAQEDDSSEKMNDSDAKQTLKRYYFNPEKNYISDKNSIIGVLRSGETECDLFTEFGKHNKQKNFGGKISIFNPYIVYPTMTTTEPVKDAEPPPRKNTYKFEHEEFVGVDHKESFDPSYQDGRNKGQKEEMDEGTDDQDQSESSDSLYFTPFILLPSDLEKNGQTTSPTVDENETLENDDVRLLDKERPSLHSIATSAIQPMMEDKGINVVDSIPESDSVKLRDVTFKTESEDSLVTEKTVVQLNRSENNDVKSVKLKAVMSVSRQPSDEKTVVAQTDKVVEKNWENLQKISFNKNDVSLQMMREVQSKPSTSFKLIQTSISITTTLPQPGCYCSTLIEPDQTKSINSISPSNDTYIVKHFPSIESNPSTEKEIQKWLHKSNSDSKIYSGKRNPEDKSQEAIKEDEECLCDDSCDRSVCPMEENTKTKKESSTPPPAKESKPSSTHPYSTTNQPQASPFSDLSELRKIIDQGFDRITNEMKEICDCKQRQMTKQEIVELVEREVMNMNGVECPAGQKNLKKEIQFTNETQTTFDLFDKLNKENKGHGPTSPNRVNIRHSIAMHESLNPGDVLVCKICANEIKISTKDAYTNTDKEMPTVVKVPKTEAEVKSIEAESFEITNSTILKKITKKEPQPSANTPVSQKLQLSAIPTPHKHHCFDIIDPGVVKKPIHSKPQTQQPPWIPTSTYNPKSSNQSNQKSESSTPKSTSPREKKRTPNTYETIKISTPDPSIKSNNSGGAGQAARPKSIGSSVHRPNATNKNIQFSTQRPTTKQTQRKNPNNFVAFPVKVSQFRLNQYIRCLQEEAIKRCQSKCAKNSSEDLRNIDKNSENLEGSVPENSDSDEFDLNEYILLRPTKSDTCSCHYTNRTNGSSGLKKGKEFQLKNPDHFLLQSNSGIETPREEKMVCPYEKAIKSEEALKKGNRKNGAEKKRKCDGSKESGRSDKTVGDTCQRSAENSDFLCDSTRHGKSGKCFFRELVNCFDSGSHSMNFKERILRSALFSDYPFSNDFDDSSPPEFTEEEEGEAVEEEMLSQKEDSNVEEGD